VEARLRLAGTSHVASGSRMSLEPRTAAAVVAAALPQIALERAPQVDVDFLHSIDETGAVRVTRNTGSSDHTLDAVWLQQPFFVHESPESARCCEETTRRRGHALPEAAGHHARRSVCACRDLPVTMASSL